MKKLQSAFDFYDLPEEDRIKMIGSYFGVSSGKRGRVGTNDWVYFPIGLSKEQFNYGVKQGLIGVSPKKNFKIFAESPDDLDLSLEFDNAIMRQEIIGYIKKIKKHNVTYKEVLEKVQEQFTDGKICT